MDSCARVLIEPGVRWDRDSFIERDFVSPRIAGTVLADLKSETKISAGVGIYYDRTNLALVSNAFQGVADKHILCSHRTNFF